MIADQGRGRPHESRLPHADAEARQQQVGEAGRGAADHRHDRPDRRGAGQDLHPAIALGQPRERDAEQAVEQRETEALQQPELEIGELEVRTQRPGDGGHHRAVGVVEQTDQEQNEQQPGAIAPAMGGDRIGLRTLRHAGSKLPLRASVWVRRSRIGA